MLPAKNTEAKYDKEEDATRGGGAGEEGGGGYAMLETIGIRLFSPRELMDESNLFPRERSVCIYVCCRTSMQRQSWKSSCGRACMRACVLSVCMLSVCVLSA